jgi:copper chaperone CopZ
MKKVIVLIAAALMSVSAFASTTATVTVKGLMCSSCAKKVQTQLMKTDSVSKVDVNFKKGFVTIAFKDGKDMTDAQITNAVQLAGTKDEYSVATITRQ